MVEKNEDRYLFPDFKSCDREEDIKENAWTHSGWRLLVDENEEDYIEKYKTIDQLYNDTPQYFIDKYVPIWQKLKINPEYAIAEYIHDKAFISCNDFILKTEDYERFPLNKEYISVFCKDRLCYKETITNLNNRTKMFSDYIKQEYHPDKTILIWNQQQYS